MQNHFSFFDDDYEEVLYVLYMTKAFRDTLTDEQYKYLLDLQRIAPDYIDSFYCDAADEQGFLDMVAKSLLDRLLMKENGNRKACGLPSFTLREYLDACEADGDTDVSKYRYLLSPDCGLITCRLDVDE